MPTKSNSSLGSTRTTCVYDPHRQRIVVAPASGGALTFAYDVGTNRTGMLQVTGIRTTWTFDSGDQPPADHRRNGGFGKALLFDPVRGGTLANLAGARTTYLYDPGCAGDGFVAPAPTTFVLVSSPETVGEFRFG